MKKYTIQESKKIIDTFLKKLKTDINKNEIIIESYNLDLEEPIFERLFCAHIKAPNNQEAILYEALEKRCFHIKMGKLGGETIPILSELNKQAIKNIPKKIVDKMYQVSISQRDYKLELIDFETPFALTKSQL